jgi:hypothetical protein
MAGQERDILERAVQALGDEAAAANTIVDEALIAGLGESHPITIQAKILRQELLQVMGELERDLSRFVLDCTACGRTVHWVAGPGVSAGHWAHREPAPHHEPAF